MIATMLMWAALLPGGVLAQTDAQTDANASVSSGGEALRGRWSGYPWYDAQADGVRRLEVKPPKQVKAKPSRSWNSGGWGGFGLGWGGVLSWLVWGLLVLVLAGVVYLLVRAFVEGRGTLPLTNGRDSKEDAVAHQRRIESLPFPVRAAGSDLLAEARRHHAEGNFGEAAKYLFSHQLVQLDKHQVIRLTRGKTNRQYLREVGSRGLLAGLVEPVMILFEDFFFGNHAIGRARFEACWSRLPEFEAQLAGEGR